MSGLDKIRRDWYQAKLDRLVCVSGSMFFGFVVTAALMLGFEPGIAAVIVLAFIAGWFFINKWLLEREFKRVTGVQPPR